MFMTIRTMTSRGSCNVSQLERAPVLSHGASVSFARWSPTADDNRDRHWGACGALTPQLA